MERQQNLGFFEALFDFSFSKFVSESLVRIVYILALIAGLIITVIGIFGAFSNGFLAGIFGIIVSPIFFIVFAVIVRVWLEFVVVIFRIADYTKRMAEKSE